MKDEAKTKRQLIKELAEMRQRDAALEESGTDRKPAEEKLQWVNSIQSLILNNSVMGIGFVRNRMFEWVNPRLPEMLGLPLDRVQGFNTRIIYSSDEAYEETGRKAYAALSRDEWFKFEISIPHANGTTFIGRIFGKALDPALPQEGSIWIFEDITARKRAEEALRKAEREKSAILDAMSEVVIYLDTDMKVIWSNSAMNRQFNMKSSQIEGRNCYEVLHKLNRPCRICPAVKAFETGKPYTIDDFSSLGKRWTLRAYPVRNEEGNLVGMVEIVTDITNRKRAEDELRESQRRLSEIIEFLPDATLVIDKDGKVIAWNRAIETMTGVKAEEMLGKSDYEYSLPFYGERRPILIDLALHADPEREKQYTAIRRTGDILFGEAYTPNLAPGNVHLSATASVLRDSSSDIIAAIECIRNNTERKNLEAQLQQAQKMEAVGTLAGGIAHDFNNLLMAIQGNASLMLMGTNSSDPRYEKLRAIEDQVVTGANLTKRILGFARVGKYELKPIDLNEVIEKSSSMFGRTKKEILINKKYEQALWAVEADASQMEQVLMNLYVNAYQAMSGGGHLYLETANLTITEIKVKSPYMKPGRYVKISVTDTGVGMDERTRERIFEPFFTTKEMGHGTGLGLAMVYGIVKGHGGYINVYSEKGKGTIFNIYLPASEKEALKDKRPEELILKGRENILLVDDERAIIDVTKEILEMLGYLVLIAANGRDALNIYQENKDKIDLVILDMIMPDLSGADTFERLKEINPDVKVILSSGYSLNGEAAGIMARGCQGFIQKPASVAELSQRVREVLGEAVKDL